MSLKSAFNWVKKRLGRQPPPEHVTLRSAAHARTSDDVFVTVPFQIKLKVADPVRYRVDNHDPDRQVKLVADMGIKTEVAATSYEDLLKYPESLCDKAQQSTKDQILQSYGLTLESIVAEKVQGPAMLAELTQEIEKAQAAAVQEAREKAKALIDGHTSAQEVMKGLDSNIQVKKPLSLKKPGQQE